LCALRTLHQGIRIKCTVTVIRNQRIGQTATDNSWLNYPAAIPSTVSYTADALNRYTAVGAVNPSYDGNSNLTSDSTFAFGYDAENRLTSAVGAGNTASYTYDAQPVGWVERSDTHHAVASPWEPADMTFYRRNFIAGGSFFFTVNLAQRRLSLLTQHIDELRTAFRETRRHHPFTIDAMVVLPDHLHAVWTLPEGDADFATCWRLIKSAFSRSLPTGERISASRAAKGERGIWQRR
jgi:REP element-mobilizing transposase RayT